MCKVTDSQISRIRMWTSLGDHYSSYNNKGGDRFREGKDLTQTTQQLVEVSELDVRP